MKSKQKAARLRARIRDYNELLSRPSDFKVQSRKDNGGYKRPGSNTR